MITFLLHPNWQIGLTNARTHRSMKQPLYALLGTLVASTLFWEVVFLSGYLLEARGIRLYESEFDQQRNFNVFMLGWLFFGIVGLWLGWRTGKSTRE